MQRAWTISQSDGELTVHGGADARYLIDLETDAPSRFASLGHDETIRRRDLSDTDQRVLEQLVTAEIVVPILATGATLRVAVLGDPPGLALPSRKAFQIVAASKAHDLAVVIRTTSTYAHLLDTLDYTSLTTPHLLADLAFHHTVSIGPLVFPGETACLACLEGRLRTRWGDDTPPPAARVADQDAGFVAELAATELVKIAGGDTSLTNKTVSWDLQSRTVTVNQLLKVPLCPVCTRSRMEIDGSLALPWGTR